MMNPPSYRNVDDEAVCLATRLKVAQLKVTMVVVGAHSVLALCRFLLLSSSHVVCSPFFFFLREHCRQEREEAKDEARVLRSLRHTCIVSCLDAFIASADLGRTKKLIGASSKQLFIIMEYCDGGNLYTASHTKSKLMPEKLIWRYFIQSLIGTWYEESTTNTTQTHRLTSSDFETKREKIGKVCPVV